MSFDIESLIYDRTAQDVLNKTDKGYYNATDLNRVQSAMEYVADRFRTYGYAVTLQDGPVWDVTDIPTQAQLTVYLTNLTTLRAVLAVLSTTPQVPPDMDELIYTEANDIEKILADIDLLLTKTAAAFRHCGAAVCGGSGLLIL